MSNGTELGGEGAVILTPHPESLKHPGNNVEAEAAQKQCSIVHRTWTGGATALGRPRGMVWGGRREEGSDGEHMYTCGGFILIFGKTNTIM